MSTEHWAVFVQVTAQHGWESQLLAALRDDKHNTLAKEAGCKKFTILVSDDDSKQFALHEVYESEQAFEIHKREPHFAAFKEAVALYGVGQPDVAVCTRVDDPSAN